MVPIRMPPLPDRDIRPIITSGASEIFRSSQGTMARSNEELTTVVFECDANGMYVRTSIFIAGSHPSIGNWNPNVVRMHDDGTQGDSTAHDGIWTVELKLPVGAEINYKYTNSGAEGSWTPGEEFSWSNRRIKVERDTSGRMIVRDTFGKL
jgi:hypothetical protein